MTAWWTCHCGAVNPSWWTSCVFCRSEQPPPEEEDEGPPPPSPDDLWLATLGRW